MIKKNRILHDQISTGKSAKGCVHLWMNEWMCHEIINKIIGFIAIAAKEQ